MAILGTTTMTEGTVSGNLKVNGFINTAQGGYTWLEGSKNPVIQHNGMTAIGGNQSYYPILGTRTYSGHSVTIGTFQNQFCFVMVDKDQATNGFKERFRYDFTDNSWRSSNANFVLESGTITAPIHVEDSDIRKKNIVSNDIPLDKCYDLIEKCQNIIYTLKNDEKNREQIGLIAQEVEEFFPEVVYTDNEGYKAIGYSRLVVICFRVLKDLIDRVGKLEDKK